MPTSESWSAVTVPGLIAQSAGAATGYQAPVPATTATWAEAIIAMVTAIPGSRLRPRVAVHAAAVASSADSPPNAMSRTSPSTASESGRP